jgi:hypothetical protein
MPVDDLNSWSVIREQGNKGMRDKKTVAIHGGGNCPKCGHPMQRFEHSKDWQPAAGRSSYRYWDRCFECKHFQNYTAAHSWTQVRSGSPIAKR